MRGFAHPWTADDHRSPLFFLVRMAAFEEHPPAELPPFLGANAASLGDGHPRPMDANLALAGVMRVLPRVNRWLRAEMEAALRPQAQGLADTAPALLGSRSATAADLLWRYWLLVLARKRLGIGVQDMLLLSLWRRAWAGQKKDGFLHGGGPEVALETAAYLDFAALHAAYNAIVFTQDYDLFPALQRLADAHAAATQPDNVTQEPWALAAFATLDAAQSFAPQQLHDATLALARIASPGQSAIAALLADAVLTQEETAASLG